jgi:hypothetical protein
MSQRVDQGELTPDIIFPYYPYQNIQSTLFLGIKKMDWVAGATTVHANEGSFGKIRAKPDLGLPLRKNSRKFMRLLFRIGGSTLHFMHSIILWCKIFQLQGLFKF